jgi:hypothetical protein
MNQGEGINILSKDTLKKKHFSKQLPMPWIKYQHDYSHLEVML